MRQEQRRKEGRKRKEVSDRAGAGERTREEGKERGEETRGSEAKEKQIRSEREKGVGERDKETRGEGERGRDGEVGDGEIKGRERMKERCRMTGDE